MGLSYMLQRKNAEYTRKLISDIEFFENAINLEKPELHKVKMAVGEGDMEKAKKEYLSYFEKSGGKGYYFGVNDIADFSAAIKNYYQENDLAPIIEEADRICGGDIPLYNGKRVKFPDENYDWNGWLYDSSQYQLVLTRFHFLLYLSRAYCITGNDKYVCCMNDILNDFIDDNPVPKDATFNEEHCTWHALNAGLRAISWTEAFTVCFTAKGLNDAVKMKMIKSLYEHGDYLRKYHATFGNHATMELRGLISIAALFPEFTTSREWMAYGYKEFSKQITENVYDDGVQFEASPTYHIVVMKDIFEILPILQRNSLDVSKLMDIVEKMYEVLMFIQTPDNLVPCFGDTHENFSIKNIMSLGAVLFGRKDFKYFGNAGFPFEYVWIIGSKVLENYHALESEPPSKTSAYFPVGGYMVSRKSWDKVTDYMIMRAGVGINGHTHADALSVILHSNGNELLKDSGMGMYEWTPERKYIISTRAHNTVVVDNQDQHVRDLHWGPPPSAPCRIWDFRSNEKFDYFFASHYGYTRFEDPVIHTRKILYVKRGYWLIIDLLSAEKHHKYDLYYHLGKDDLRISSGLDKIMNAGDSGLLLMKVENKNVKTFVEEDLLYSDHKYVKSHTVRYSQEFVGTAVFETVLVPFSKDGPEISVERSEAYMEGRQLAPFEATALKISYQGITDCICLNHVALNVGEYLDHTGNPVNDKLIQCSADNMRYEFCGKTYTSDVIIKS